MNWELFSIIGTIAFAVSGAIVAMEEEYDILGVYVLGLVTAFGGGVIRNLLIGKPIVLLWEQGLYFQIALFAMTLVFCMPVRYIRVWKTWEAFFDAIGLAAFSIQGALYATNMGHPLSAIIVAAVLTGIGGGMVRDVLAGRKPLVLKDEIYAVWGMLAGALVGLGWTQGAWQLAVLFVLIVVLRMLSVFYKWKLPKRSLRGAIGEATRRSDS
ncbi:MULTISPECIES: trimeric intracellular cation channel family protein [unclassified Paenibacillus]|uniref:trimeric intracellular cation channel family protein n=1 Tax=unclassified Paenibacillus TaxID=185978 RepID=UPI002787C32F|nr:MULTISPECIES: trimeric intracellular cation channel family protein [unclassified Paenibacillus]MDF2646585.1 trimeric intracellular cation channel family protein [Paenibacillus sp.]MDQ0898613.1 putative membrane protein YeiH [Paenibacillus sp. V4I7]MDQ0915396.1 putative membrane protein YeiH [Paenibacillus sp. V4I5]